MPRPTFLGRRWDVGPGRFAVSILRRGTQSLAASSRRGFPRRPRVRRGADQPHGVRVLRTTGGQVPISSPVTLCRRLPCLARHVTPRICLGRPVPTPAGSPGGSRVSGPETSPFEVRMIPIATVLVLFTMFAAMVWALVKA
jgi:hypothetical protein